MKLRTNLLQAVLLVGCLIINTLVILTLSNLGVLDYKNMALFTVLVLTMITVSVVIETPNYVKRKYNLQ